MVIPAVPALQQQGAVAPKCRTVPQLGPVNTYLKSHFLGMGTRKFKTSGIRPRPKTYAYVTVRRTGHGQLCCLQTKQIQPFISFNLLVLTLRLPETCLFLYFVGAYSCACIIPYTFCFKVSVHQQIFPFSPQEPLIRHTMGDSLDAESIN